VEQGLEVMTRFHRDVFSAEAIREYATELKYTAKIIDLLRREIDIQGGEISDELMRWILKNPGIYDGSVTAKTIERFKPIAKTALQRIINEIVRRVLREIDDKVTRPVSVAPEAVSDAAIDAAAAAIEASQSDDTNADEKPHKGREICTTDEELKYFAVLKKMFDGSIYATKKIYDPAVRSDVPIEIAYKDTTAYLNVYFNKPSWWIMRLSVESKIKWIGFDIDPEFAKDLTPSKFEILKPSAFAEFRVRIESSQDLLTLSEVIRTCFEKTIEDREKLRHTT